MPESDEIVTMLSEAVEGATPNCSDLDDDCASITDKVHCYLYDPAKGFCPFLR